MTKTKSGAAANQEVTRPAQTALAESDVYGDDAGKGYEGQDAAHLAIPFIGVLQPLSPQLQDEAQFPGWKAGLLFNTVTNDLYGQHVNFVPAHVERAFVEWVPREKGGGFQGLHAVDAPSVAEAAKRKAENKEATFGGRLPLANGNELVDTFYWYGALLGEDAKTPLGMAVIAFTSTKIKIYRAYNTKLNLFAHAAHGISRKPPLFAHRIRVGTVKQENQKGVFWNYTLTPAVEADVAKSLLLPSDPAYLEARQVRDLVVSGKARAAFETQGGAGGEAGEDEGKPPF